jgi:hypothetical protein
MVFTKCLPWQNNQDCGFKSLTNENGIRYMETGRPSFIKAIILPKAGLFKEMPPWSKVKVEGL